MQQMLDSNSLTPTNSSKMAGRFSFSATVSGNRVGRACIKPFYAQAHSPFAWEHAVSMAPTSWNLRVGGHTEISF